jgi:hypothetical protein
MKINVIDYDNAKNDDDLTLLDQYRRDKGLLDRTQKTNTLNLFTSAYETARMQITNPEKYGGLGKVRDSIELVLKDLGTVIKRANEEYKYTGDSSFLDSMKDIYEATSQLEGMLSAPGVGDTKLVQTPTGYTKVVQPVLGPKERAEQRRKEREEKKRLELERRRKEAEERRKKLALDAKRREQLVILEQKAKIIEEIKRHEQKYQTILGKFVKGTKVDDKDLEELGKDVNKVKQEAENKIAEMPREERELRLALIRGDKISDKTFSEMKITAAGLHLSLQEYITEVNKIPTGSFIELQSVPTGKPTVVN